MFCSLSDHISELISLFSKFYLQLCLLHLQESLNGFKGNLVSISGLLNWHNRLLLVLWSSINRGITHNSSSGWLNSLRSLRPQNWSGNLLRRWLLCCAIRVILTSYKRFVWLRSLGLLLLLLGDGGLFSRRGSTEVDRLSDLEAYWS